MTQSQTTRPCHWHTEDEIQEYVNHDEAYTSKSAMRKATNSIFFSNTNSKLKRTQTSELATVEAPHQDTQQPSEKTHSKTK